MDVTNEKSVSDAIEYEPSVRVFKNNPIYREARQNDMRIVAHKSGGLAAQNFIMSMAAINYNTYPMDGFDSLRIKKILHLPASSEINRIIGCDLREAQRIYGGRF